MNRRSFLTGAAGVVSLHSFPHHLFASSTKKLATDRILLGPRKVELSRLAMGTGTNGAGGSSNQTRKLGVGGVAELFRAAYDQGLTFWDSADQYGIPPPPSRGAEKRSPGQGHHSDQDARAHGG